MTNSIPYKAKYFKKQEFTCKCGCGKTVVKDELLQKLDHARYSAKIPFIINSGYRCVKHNNAVGGVINSAHTKGEAVDILTLAERDRYIILGALIRAGFGRIGIARSYIHADISKTLPQSVIWLY